MQDTGYTPTLSDIRQAWAYFQSESVSYTGSPGSEFNRWLNKIKADVWDEGALARAGQWIIFLKTLTGRKTDAFQ